MEAPRPSCPKCSQTQVIKKGVIALFPNPKGQVRVLNLGIFDYPPEKVKYELRLLLSTKRTFLRQLRFSMVCTCMRCFAKIA
jgi:hypothetical protein